jgi:hypothetical protein
MVLISHTFKCVFIHIPKNAGSYVKDILGKIDPENIEIKEHIYGHHPFHRIKELPIYNEIKDYTFFCVIRDPIDMIVSHYNYILTCGDSHYLYSKVKDKLLLEVSDLILDDNGELNLFYIKYNADRYNEKSNPVNKNIIKLNFDNISEEFKKFLLYINVPEVVLNKINFLEKCNESKKFFVDYSIINNHYLNYPNTTIQENKYLIENNKQFII